MYVFHILVYTLLGVVYTYIPILVIPVLPYVRIFWHDLKSISPLFNFEFSEQNSSFIKAELKP